MSVKLKFNSKLRRTIGIYCIRINSLDVPSAATVGTEVRLFCDYDLERQGLYQIKWYKGSHEFYRYSPGETTKKKSFLVNNLNVDVRKSDDRTVVLNNLHVDMTGRYTCEVSTEGIFETVKESAKMTVIAKPRGGPHIQGIEQDLKIGDTINLNCTSLKSKPAANLTFYINGRNATDMRKIKLNSALITNEENERNRESSLLSMQFKIRRHHVKNARIEIRCEAKIFNMFSRTRDKEIFVKTHSAENQHQPQNNFHSSQPSSTIIFEFGKFKIIILLTFFSFFCA